MVKGILSLAIAASSACIFAAPISAQASDNVANATPANQEAQFEANWIHRRVIRRVILPRRGFCFRHPLAPRCRL